MKNKLGASIIPSIRYADAPAALKWLVEAFGFQEHLVVADDDGGIAHAQLIIDEAMVMIGSARDDEFGQFQQPLANPNSPVSQSIYMIVEDVDQHCLQATNLGASIVVPPEDQPYGGRLYSCRDPEGNLWSFGSYDPWQG